MGDSRGQGRVLALEGRVARATTQSVHRRVPEAGAERVGAVPAFRGQPENGIQMARPVSCWLRARRPLAAAAQQSQGRGSGARGCHRRRAKRAAELGAEEAPRGAEKGTSRHGAALDQHVRAHLQTQRARHAATKEATRAAVLEPLSHAGYPNALWCIDFKGDFSVGQRRCYPLTVTDAYSRFLLGCVALPNTRVHGVRRALLTLFQTFGLPEAIRSDNGSPFASKAPEGLSELCAWGPPPGLRHERIDPGKPQQNGRHERMHLTLKRETVSPPATSFRGQQRLFDRSRRRFNELPRTRLSPNAFPPSSTGARRASSRSRIGAAT